MELQDIEEISELVHLNDNGMSYVTTQTPNPDLDFQTRVCMHFKAVQFQWNLGMLEEHLHS